jgi:type III secretion protein L
MGTLLYLKNGSYAPSSGLPVLKKKDYALLLQAEQILAHARAEAEAIRLEAQKAYETEKKRGYEQGLNESKMEMAERMLDTVSAGVDYLASLEGTLSDLVMNSLHKVIEGFEDKERVTGVVRKALGYVRAQKRVVLRLCPEDAELVRDEWKDLQRDYPGIGTLDISADPRLSRGACLLESELGIIDASLEIQMAAIRNSFTRQLKQGARNS